MYYLYYDEKATVNYCFLFSLRLIAERDTKEKIYNRITYTSIKELCQKIKEKCNYNISVSSVSRILNNTEYNNYFTVEIINHKKVIILNTNFKNGKNNCNKFIVLSDREMLFLLKQNDILLNKYYCYLRYYCGYNKTKSTDSTAEQILSAIGYATNGSSK